MKWSKTGIYFLTAGLFLLAVFSRFYRLDNLPMTRQYDELVYILNAQSAILSGTNLNNDWQPWSFKPVMPMYSELTTTVLMPWLSFNLPLKIASFLPFIFISLASPALIALLLYELTKNKKLAYWSWLIALFNPFIWQMGRLGFDSMWSFFFYLLGAWLFLRLKKWQKLWSLLPFIFGFYQYQGHKALLPFLLLSLTFYQVWPLLKQKFAWKKWLQFLPEFFISLVLIGLTTFYVLVLLPQQTNLERTSTLLSPNSELITTKISTLRRLTLISPLKNVLTNKYLATGQEIVNRIVGSYNLDELFLASGEDNKMFYVVSNHGLFYLFDGLLILAGIIYLVKNKNWRLGLFLLGLMLAATAPTWIADGEWYFYRAAFRVVPMIILAALGCEYFWTKIKLLGKIFLLLSYFFSGLYFANLYFNYLPLKAAADPFFADVVLSQYLQQEDGERPVSLMVNDHRVTWMNHLYYTGGLNKENLTQAKENWQSEKIAWENLTFGPNCFDPEKVKASSDLIVIAYDYRGCDDNATSVKNELKKAGISHKVIRSPIDGGEKYFLINDQVCEEKDLAGTLLFKNWNELELAKLSQADLCRLWISPEN